MRRYWRRCCAPTPSGPLEPWDWRYYAEQRRKALHDLDEAALKPYLSLDG